MKRVTAGFGLLAVLFMFLLVLVNVGPVWADTINPNPPIAGQPFTISGTATTGGFGSLYAGSGCSVVNSITNVFDPSPGSFTDSFPGQPAGSYSFSHEGDASGCVNFTVNSAASPIPEYPLGLPILAILTIIGYGLVRPN
ncbi:MAG: hypothetical protein ABSD99_07195 [Candidatus Bathyarchaeia archaeon]